MNERVRVFVFAGDPISQAGTSGQLRGRNGITVVDDVDQAEVAVVVCDRVDDEAVRVIRGLQRNGIPKVVVAVGVLDDAGVLAAAEAGACGLLRRAEASPERLEEVIAAAASGAGSLPPDVQARLLARVGDLQRQVLQPRGLTFSALTARELDVLRLVAEGCDTAEISSALSYSERTVKSIVHEITTRLGVRNRSHAVACAVREGLI